MSKSPIQVSVAPEYLPEESHPKGGVFGFAYTVTITNTGNTPVQLIARHWIISDALGLTEEVRGLGVVGQQPLIKPGESFQYTSGCRLRTASGTMHGSYLCVNDEGEPFRVAIPLFVLEAVVPGDDGQPQPARVLH